MKLYRKGLTDGEIAERVAVTMTAIWEWRNRKHGLPPNGYIIGERHERRLEFYRQGYSIWIRKLPRKSG